MILNATILDHCHIGSEFSILMITEEYLSYQISLVFLCFLNTVLFVEGNLLENPRQLIILSLLPFFAYVSITTRFPSSCPLEAVSIPTCYHLDHCESSSSVCCLYCSASISFSSS